MLLYARTALGLNRVKENFSKNPEKVYTMCMTIKIYPFTAVQRSGNAYVYVTLALPDTRITLSGFSSVEDARHQAELIVQQLEAGEITIDTLRKRRKFRGKTVVEWAAHFKVSRNALYKAARNKNLSVEEEILKRLPICEK